LSEIEHLPVAIVGAGFAGLALAVRLREAGIDDFALLERADSVGGVWRDNTYPGCACDVPSALYSLSFAPNPDWSRAYAAQPEILAYARGIARERDVVRRVRFGTDLLEARWDDPARLWRLRTSTGELTAGVLVSATGPFGEPVIPNIPGREDFAGTTFHSARWNHDHDLRGERVAVIGTGASAAQFIPAIQPDVERLVVFQRTPPWIMPRLDRRSPAWQRALFRAMPQTQSAMRGGLFAAFEGLGLVAFVDQRFRHLYEAIGRWQLRRQVPDPALRARLTPDYMIGCKRAILTDAYLPALTRPNVEVVTEGIASLSERGVVTGDGTEHEVDTIIWGTGFDAPSRRAAVIHGRDGRSVIDLYDERPQSYLGTTLAGFPNLFVVLGPYSAAGNQSALYMIENQVRYIVDAVRTMRRRGIAVAEVRTGAQEAFLAEVEERSRNTVWVNGGCRSYYQTPDGRNAGLWPNWSFRYARRTRRFDADAYELTPA
jgi:cation diffusion facilitator CzcD-associated flavoprotein CzcO